MSELIRNRSWSNIGGQLLTTVSVLALLLSVSEEGPAYAADNDSKATPQISIELGGQLARVDDGEQLYSQPFFDALSEVGLPSPFDAERPARYSREWDGAISFSPRNSNWDFVASIRYGRSDRRTSLHRETAGLVSHYTPLDITQSAVPNYVDTTASNTAAYAIADFQAGKDIGLGLFGTNSSSILNFGVRFAQFTSRAKMDVRAVPNAEIVPVPFYGFQFPVSSFHQYSVSTQRAASFSGLGPSLSWNASTPFAGSSDAGEIAVDWGVNASVLFGRQKSQFHSHTSGYAQLAQLYDRTVRDVPRSNNANRSRSAIVPNIGAFAGVSFRYLGGKVAFGYRADFFFNAMDSGIDMRKSSTIGFYGPVATISVGLGG